MCIKKMPFLYKIQTSSFGKYFFSGLSTVRLAVAVKHIWVNARIIQNHNNQTQHEIDSMKETDYTK